MENKPHLEAIKQQKRVAQYPQRRLPPLQRKPTFGQPRTPRTPKCRRCGKNSHPCHQCPARDATCHRCKRQGHYSSQCLSKTVAELTTEVQDLTVTDPDHHTDKLTFSDVVYLNTVGGDSATEQNSTTSWNVQVAINNKVLLFKVDTGADVTAMSESAW